MKQGANFQDINKIRELAAGGSNADEVSHTLRIAKGVVSKFMPKPKPKVKPKPKPAE